MNYKNVIAGIISHLKTEFPTVNYESRDLSEGFLRPCFFVWLDNINVTNYHQQMGERSLTARISYFPTDMYTNNIELLETQQRLEDLFICSGGFNASDGTYVPVNDINMEISDEKILNANFDIMKVGFMPEEVAPKVDTINLDINNN